VASLHCRLTECEKGTLVPKLTYSRAQSDVVDLTDFFDLSLIPVHPTARWTESPGTLAGRTIAC